MTKQEAIQAMEKGEKVTHTYFSPDEWITIQNGSILTEEGYLIYQDEFWSYRENSYFNEGWELYKSN